VSNTVITFTADHCAPAGPEVEAAVAYYASYPAEIDERIRLNLEAQAEAEALAAGREQLLR
jgi:hypothetical protein